MVAVSAEKSPPLSDGLIWRPEASKDIRGIGQELWCPKPGSGDDLEEGYQQTCNRSTTLDFTWRPTVRKRVRYVCDASVISRPWTAFSLVRLTDDRTVAWDGIRQIEIAAMARHAVSELFEKEGFPDSWRRIFVQGHGDTKEQKDIRLSYVPLPTIGHEHVDGEIRRLLVVGPPGGDRDILERVQWGLPTLPLTKDGVPRVRLTGPRKEDKVLRQYTATAETWMSVTPVILPAYGDPAEALFRAMEHVGIKPGAVEDVWYQNMPFWSGSSPSWSYKVANYMHYPRYHVRVRFREPVTGPLVMGRGRHYGLGVMAAER